VTVAVEWSPPHRVVDDDAEWTPPHRVVDDDAAIDPRTATLPIRR